MAIDLNDLDATALRALIDATQAEHDEIANLIAPLETKRRKIIDRIGVLQEREAELKKDDLLFVINNHAAYKQWQALLPRQTYSLGYWADSGEQAFKLKLNRNEEPEQALLDFIDRWAPLVKVKRMGVFRYDLCERGTWIVEKIDDLWCVYDERSYNFKYRHEYEFKSADLKEVIRYVAKHHFYQDENGGSYRDSDDDY